MDLKRVGHTLINQDVQGLEAAKKRLEANKDRKRKDELLMELSNKVSLLEKEISFLKEKMLELEKEER